MNAKKLLTQPTPEETAQEIVEAVVNEPLALKTVTYRHEKWWGRLLQAVRILPRTRVIMLTAACASTMIRVSGLLCNLKDIPNKSKERLMVDIYRLIDSELPKVLDALAFAIHNAPGVPPSWIYMALRYQFNQEELAMATYHVHRRLGIENFFVIMAFAKNLAASDMLETAAHGQPSAESSSTTD